MSTTVTGPPAARAPTQATEALIDLVADRLGLARGQQVCDIGCGYGATAQRLAERHAVHVTGVTVSAAQAAVASAARGPPTEPRHPPPGLARQRSARDAGFDRACAIESREHMEDKRALLRRGLPHAQARRPSRGLRLARPRPAPRPWEVRWLLEPICREGRLPGMGDEADYRRLAAEAGFTVSAVEDLSDRVRRHLVGSARARVAGKLVDRAAIRAATSSTARRRTGIFALTLLRLLLAYRTGSMRYALLLFERPQFP